MIDFKKCFNNKYFETNLGYIINDDCIKIMDEMIGKNIKFDAIIADIPQEITQNDWDRVIPLEKMWKLLYKLRKDERTPIILFTNQPFTTDLISSNKKHFKYLKYWQKDRPSGFLNAKRQPLRDVEEIAVFCEEDIQEVGEIAVFYEKQCTYNPQMVEGNKNHSIGKVEGEDVCKNNSNYGDFGRVNTKGNMKYPRQLMYYPRPHPPIHPTEKPLELLEDLIRTYSNKGDLILDFTAGSISLGKSAENLGRRWICIEKEKDYCELGKNRFIKL